MKTELPAILRIKEVIAYTGLSRSTIYARMDKKSSQYDENFPLQIRLGGATSSAVGWVASEINKWIESQSSNRSLEPTMQATKLGQQ